MKTKKILKQIADSLIFRIAIIGIIVYIISANFFQLYFVSGESMLPTYSDGRLLIISKFNVLDRITYNDVVIIKSHSADTTIIKRIIAMPGDTVFISDGIVYVNNTAYSECISPEPVTDPGAASSPITLKSDEYFVLGDNRNSSIDSRFEPIGIIHAAEITGKVL